MHAEEPNLRYVRALYTPASDRSPGPRTTKIARAGAKRSPGLTRFQGTKALAYRAGGGVVETWGRGDLQLIWLYTPTAKVGGPADVQLILIVEEQVKR